MLLFLLLAAASPSIPADLHGKSVLVLHSYYKGYRWTDDEGRGLDSVLLPELGASNIYIEYMDTKRFYGRDSKSSFPTYTPVSSLPIVSTRSWLPITMRSTLCEHTATGYSPILR